MTIYQANRPDTEKVCDTADDVLEYMLGDDRLGDVVTKVQFDRELVGLQIIISKTAGV